MPRFSLRGTKPRKPSPPKPGGDGTSPPPGLGAPPRFLPGPLPCQLIPPPQPPPILEPPLPFPLLFPAQPRLQVSQSTGVMAQHQTVYPAPRDPTHTFTEVRGVRRLEPSP